MSDSFAASLRRLRATAGLTQEQLAERAHLSAKAVSALERGERLHPYPHTVRSLASALALSADEAASLEAAARRQRPDTVPVAATPLVGRGAEVAALVTLLAEREV